MARRREHRLTTHLPDLERVWLAIDPGHDPVQRILLWAFQDRDIANAGRDVLGGVFISTYPPLLAGFAVMHMTPEDGLARVFTFLIIGVCSDVGGYAAGVLFGKHPMAPPIRSMMSG